MKKLSPLETKLTFDPIKHEYFVGKKKIPSVSQILQKVGLTKNYDGINTFYRDRGIAVHKAIELHLKGILDPASLDEAIKPQFNAFLSYWKKHEDEKILAIEIPLVNHSETFAGTADLITNKALYDYKCSKDHDRVADLQGQAYKILNEENSITLPKIKPFIVVELHEDGSFEEFDYGSGANEWSCVMKLFDWKKERREKAKTL